VPEDVWNFHIGGYQVCEKWLKDRKDRRLSKQDIAHYQRIVVAIAETIRLMKEIDEAIDAHGGWPGAFARTDKNDEAPGRASEAAKSEKVVPLQYLKSGSSEFDTSSIPMVKAAESEAPSYQTGGSTAASTTHPNPDELDRGDLMCRIRGRAR